MNEDFDYDPPEGPLDCCSGMSRHGRLLQESRAPIRVPVSAATTGKEQRRLIELMQQLKRPAPQPADPRG